MRRAVRSRVIVGQVNNQSPVLSLNAVTAINENGVATLSGTIADVSPLNTFTLSIDWGDPLSPNNIQTVTFPASASGSQAFSLTHQYLDNPNHGVEGSYTISATVHTGGRRAEAGVVVSDRAGNCERILSCPGRAVVDVLVRQCKGLRSGRAGGEVVRFGVVRAEWIAPVDAQRERVERAGVSDRARDCGIAILKMQNCSEQEIAELIGCSVRTVRRRIALISETWERELPTDE